MAACQVLLRSLLPLSQSLSSRLKSKIVILFLHTTLYCTVLCGSIPPLTNSRLRVFVVEFSDGMRAFLNKSHDAEAADAFDSASWDDLHTEAAKAMLAAASHQLRRRTWHNPFEAADRVGGAVARRIEFLVELFPDGEYSHILAGGLRLLYNVRMPSTEG